MAFIKSIYCNNSVRGDRFFQEDIEKVVALAVLMPIVASMGGNAGMQTLAVLLEVLQQMN